jgi:iron complex outermembrane receptor protein
MPTFNQLFWAPGGNVNLSSERSESGEIVVSRRSAKSYTSLTLYGNQIRDAIRWLPSSNGIFTAQQVRGQTQNTSGIELSHRTDLKKAYITSGASYQRAFVSGTDTEIPLIPRLQGSLEAGYRFSKTLTVYYRPRYWSSRFTDMNNVEELPEIWLHGCGFEFDRTWLTISLMINNAANQFYTFLPYRPNTPRNFEFTISYKI